MKALMQLFALLVALAGVVSCNNDGTAEQLGEDIDQFADEVGDEAEQAADEAEEAAERLAN